MTQRPPHFPSAVLFQGQLCLKHACWLEHLIAPVVTRGCRGAVVRSPLVHGWRTAATEHADSSVHLLCFSLAARPPPRPVVPPPRHLTASSSCLTYPCSISADTRVSVLAFRVLCTSLALYTFDIVQPSLCSIVCRIPWALTEYPYSILLIFLSTAFHAILTSSITRLLFSILDTYVS